MTFKYNVYLVMFLSLLSTNCSSFGLIEPSKIDREGIRKVFYSNQKQIAACYEAIPEKNRPSGKIVFDFDIDDTGKVTRAIINNEKSTLHTEEPGACITNHLKTWVFPPSPATTTTQIFYPIVLKSGDTPKRDKTQ